MTGAVTRAHAGLSSLTDVPGAQTKAPGARVASWAGDLPAPGGGTETKQGLGPGAFAVTLADS